MNVPSDTSPPAAEGRKFWQRWLTDPVMRQLTQGVTPQKLALTIAVGSVLAVFPILGTTTTLCVIAGVALKLNQPIIQGVNLLCAFIWVPLLVAFVRLGDVFAGSAHASLDIPYMISLFAHHPGDFFRQFGVTALHAIMGWAAVAPLWVPAAYFLALPPLRAAARRMGRGDA